MTNRGFSRRNILRVAALGGAQLALGMRRLRAEGTKGTTVDSRFWLWSHIAGAYTGEFGLEGGTLITPVEAAHYLGTPNVFMVEYYDKPTPSQWKQCSVAFQSLGQISWSIVPPGENVRSTPAERDIVLNFAFSNPQITSVVMDDFFSRRKTWSADQVAALSVEELQNLRPLLKRGDKRLDLWEVLYHQEVNDPSFPKLAPYLKLCDIVQLWPWHGKEIPNLEETLAKVERLVPGKKIALGCFMWDFGGAKPLSVSQMQEQCEFGLKCLHQGRIEAMIFGASWLCDRGLEAVRWTRQWIQKVGDQKLST